MSSERHPIWDALDGMQMDLRAAQAKLTSVRSFVAGLELPDEARSRCDRCGITFAGPLPLAEHVYHSHDGPVPAHWEAIEARSACGFTMTSNNGTVSECILSAGHEAAHHFRIEIPA